RSSARRKRSATLRMRRCVFTDPPLPHYCTIPGSPRSTLFPYTTLFRSQRRPFLRERRDVDLSLARAVELAEEDPLPRSQRELAVVERHEDLRADQRRANVRRSVRPVRILDVIPVPNVVDELLECRLEVEGDGRV